MSNSLTGQTLALAAILMAVAQVQNVARRGRTDPEPFETCIRSVGVDEPEIERIYGGIAPLREGLRLITKDLGNAAADRDVERVRYLITLLHLERKLAKRRDLLDLIGRGLENTRRQAEHFHPTHDNVVAGLADLYVNTLSTLSPRIIVSGEQGHLNNPDNANKVRALLLAGMRAATLWRWFGGSRLRLLLSRRRYLEEAQRLLAQAG